MIICYLVLVKDPYYALGNYSRIKIIY